MSVQTSLELLFEGVLGQLPEKARSEVSIAQYSTTRLIQLINDLLDIDKMEAGKFDIAPRRSDIGWIFERCVGAVKAYAERHQITIDLPDDDDDAQIYGDPDRLSQIIINLLSNAIKYSPPGATVALTYEDQPRHTLVKVTDCGRGIPEGFEQKIFERFQQVDPGDERERKGTGLGLAICKALVEAHHGEIGVERNNPAGCTFWFRLPKQ
jgi:signal transduction histidine kinase